MRAFVALELPESFAEELDDFVRALRHHVEGRFSPRENRHLTLAFLGNDVGEREASAAIAALDEACACVTEPITISPRGLGSFGRRADKLLFLDVEPTAPLLGLATELRAGLAARGVAYDDKPFVPHITLVRRPRLLSYELGDLPFPLSAPARHVTLFRSDLSAAGARYKPLYRAELTPAVVR